MVLVGAGLGAAGRASAGGWGVGEGEYTYIMTILMKSDDPKHSRLIKWVVMMDVQRHMTQLD